ncbi:MAG: efflux RND transporter periplasmic adaptor subunit [Chloroherpetonaceae bacterium]|nr:efflux RND transporter periplasmic adaptor subunit [Chloroherpetonaceae bacterium]
MNRIRKEPLRLLLQLEKPLFVNTSAYKTLTFFCIAVLSLIIFANGCKNTVRNEEAQKPIQVTTAPVERLQIAEPIKCTGLVMAKEESRLSFKIGGIVEKIFVREGMTVQKGQLLATLNLSEINAEVIKAKNGLEKAERDLTRVKNLYADKVATLEQLQDATTGFEVAKSNYTIASFNQQFASIKAPTSGKVLKKYSEENELVNAGMPILQLSNYSQGYVVKVGLSGVEAVRVRVGDRAEVTLEGYPDLISKAVISQISGTASQGTGTFETELRLLTSPERVLSGLVAKVTIYPTPQKTYALIPIEAFLEGDGKSGFVFSKDSNSLKAKKIQVQFAFIHHEKLAIINFPESVSEVITEGAPYLKDGAEIAQTQ